MATTAYYVGPRPVLRGRNWKNSVNPYTGKTATYSNWSLFNTEHVLDGAPIANVTPGTGKFPGDYFMSYIRRGGQHVAPLSAINGLGTAPRQPLGHYGPNLYRGLTGAKAMPTGYGHTPRVTAYSEWSNYVYGGLSADSALPTGYGHARRAVSTSATFGSFQPKAWKGVAPSIAMPVVGSTTTAAYTNAYGKNRTKEWRGTPSSKAL